MKPKAFATTALLLSGIGGYCFFSVAQRNRAINKLERLPRSVVQFSAEELKQLPTIVNGRNKISLIVISEFQCAGCITLAKQLASKEFKSIGVEVKYFSYALKEHPKAKDYARYFLAGSRQRTPGEVYFLLAQVAKIGKLISPEDFCERLKINSARFVKDLADPELAKELAREFTFCESHGVPYVPYVIVRDESGFQREAEKEEDAFKIARALG